MDALGNESVKETDETLGLQDDGDEPTQRPTVSEIIEHITVRTDCIEESEILVAPC